ncbi:MAG: thiamine phosphate synthase [Polaromonas sp.]
MDKARRHLPPDVFIGWSVESMADLLQSATLPVDYLGVSPIFEPPSKTDTKTAWGIGGLAEVRACTRLPLAAFMRTMHLKCCVPALTAWLSSAHSAPQTTRRERLLF